MSDQMSEVRASLEQCTQAVRMGLKPVMDRMNDVPIGLFAQIVLSVGMDMSAYASMSEYLQELASEGVYEEPPPYEPLQWRSASEEGEDPTYYDARFTGAAVEGEAALFYRVTAVSSDDGQKLKWSIRASDPGIVPDEEEVPSEYESTKQAKRACEWSNQAAYMERLGAFHDRGDDEGGE